MNHLRQFLVAFALAAVFAFGQHAALLHDLGHASQILAKHDSTPAPSKCDQHSAFCNIGGAVASNAPAAPFVAAALTPAESPSVRSASLPPRFSFRSRAPPSTPA